MKFIRKYYGYLTILFLFIFAGIGAWYSTPMLPDVEIEFKGPIRMDIHKRQAPPPLIYNPWLNI